MHFRCIRILISEHVLHTHRPLRHTLWSYLSMTGRTSVFSRKNLLFQRTHLSINPGAQRTLSHVFSWPTLGSLGNRRGMSCRKTRLKRMNCCPSLHAATMCVWWLRDRLFTPDFASPITSELYSGCNTQQWMPYLSGDCKTVNTGLVSACWRAQCFKIGHIALLQHVSMASAYNDKTFTAPWPQLPVKIHSHQQGLSIQ